MGAPLAHAEGDVIRELDVTYDVQADGSVNVTWEVDWDFGETGRLGIITDFMTREPWEDDPEKDARYEISNVDVSSPTGANDSFRTSTVRDGEFEFLSVEIGGDDDYLDESRHTYVITYEATGMLRTFDGEPELFWDVNSENDVRIESANITVTAPEGVMEARCLQGANECSATVTDGTATYSATNVENEILSVVAVMPAGSVADAEPDLVDASSHDGGSARGGLGVGLALVAGAIAAVARTVTSWFRRPGKRNQRWTNVPPGEMDPGGSTTTDPFPGSSPVRFTPPDGTLIEVGRAFHGGYRPSHLTATLVQMAVDGSLKVQSDPLTVVQADGEKVRDVAQQALYLHASKPGQESPLNDTQAIAMTQAAQQALPKRDLAVTQRPEKRTGSALPLVVAQLIVLAVAANLFPSLIGEAVPALSSIPASLIVLIVVGLVIGWKIGAFPALLFSDSDQPAEALTARGSALKVQAEGFREYLATAEAGQLNFEADRDIYRRFLPWAILFDLTDRWTEIGDELIAMGRMPAESLAVVGGVRDSRSLNRTVRTMNDRSRAGERRLTAQRREAQRRRSSSSRSYGSGSGGRSGRSSSSRGGGGGGGSRSRSR